MVGIVSEFGAVGAPIRRLRFVSFDELEIAVIGHEPAAPAQQLFGQRGILDPHFVGGGERRADDAQQEERNQKTHPALWLANVIRLAVQFKVGTT